MSQRAKPKLEVEQITLDPEAFLETSANAQSILETVRTPLLLLDGALRIHAANRAFYQKFHAAPAETIGQFLLDLANGQWNIPRLREVLNEVLRPGNGPQLDFEFSHEFHDIGRRTLLMNARCVNPAAGAGNGICVSFEDVTDTRAAWEMLQRLNGVLQERARRRTGALEALHRELEAFLSSASRGGPRVRGAEKESRQGEVVAGDLPVCYLMPPASNGVVKDCRPRKDKPSKNSAPMLTRRQRRVLQLVGEGNSFEEISRVLGVSVKAAEKCCSQMMAALHIKDIAGLRRYAIQIGIVGSES